MSVKIAQAVRISPPAEACAHGKSSDLPNWVTPHQEEKTGGPERVERQNMWGDHLFPAFTAFFSSIFLPLFCREGENTWVSSFFHPVSVLPGAVQFLDSSLSISSRLLLSISCSSLLPPHLSWSSVLWLETSKPGRFCHSQKSTFKIDSREVSVQLKHLDGA